MNDVVAVLEDDNTTKVMVVAEALAALLETGVRRCRLPEGDRPARTAALDATLSELAPAAAVLTSQVDEPLCWHMMRRASFPVAVVPRHNSEVPKRIREVLVPMDGAPETARGVAPLVKQFAAADVRVVALHVFDETTVPAFWDQAAHSHQHWTGEFLLKNLPGAADLDLRRGQTAEQVLAAERRHAPDLIVIGWSQRLSAARARTVRQMIDAGSAPVLLVPAGRTSAKG